jgi:hypothetical protein
VVNEVQLAIEVLADVRGHVHRGSRCVGGSLCTQSMRTLCAWQASMHTL